MNLPKGWAITPLETLLDYEQPQAYIVESTAYSNDYPTPVLTAGKSFIIGHTDEENGIYADRLPVIIFDDFTTATQFVTFPFKVKSSAMKMLQPASSELNIKYLFYRMQLIRHSTTTHKRYWISDYSKNLIELPPLAEQHRIVAKIDALFSKLDKGVEMLQVIRQQLKTYRQAVLKWAFEGRLTNTHISEKRKLLDLCFFITKGTTPKSNDMSSEGSGIPFIKVYNLTFSGYLDFTVMPTFVSQETHTGFLARSKVLPGDVLMNIVGPPMGKVSIATEKYSEWNLNQAIARFRCNDGLYNKYLSYFLLSDMTVRNVTKKAKATAGQFNLTLEICRDIEIPYCSVESQKSIVSAIESRLSVCDELELLVDNNLVKAQALRQSILKKAFAGELVPQDPNDEPAEKLLDRIKALVTVSTTQTATARKKKK